MTTLNDNLFDPMRAHLNKELLRYAAGQTMFCPLCGNVLDAKRVVVISAGKVTKTCCAPCWDTELKPIISPERLAQCEIVDGREIFKR